LTYVVKDKYYKRVKVKSPAYVAVSRLITGFNDRRVLDLLLTNETEEFLTYFPEYKSFVDSVRMKFDALNDYLENIIETRIINNQFETRKEFAAIAVGTICPEFFFTYYDKKVKTPLEWLRTRTGEQLLRYIERC